MRLKTLESFVAIFKKLFKLVLESLIGNFVSFVWRKFNRIKNDGFYVHFLFLQTCDCNIIQFLSLKDLAARNVLVGRQRASTPSPTRPKEALPVICKLSDFGLCRSVDNSEGLVYDFLNSANRSVKSFLLLPYVLSNMGILHSNLDQLSDFG